MSDWLSKIFVSNQRVRYNNSEQFKPDRLISLINKEGVAGTHTYEVIVYPPTFGNGATESETPVLSSSLFAKNKLRFRVEQCELPGRNVKTTDYAIANQPIQQIGYGFTYAPIQMIVACNENLDEKVFFEQWQELESNASDKGNDKYTSNYYQNYVANVEINQYDKEGRLVYSCLLINAHPTFMGPINIGWASTEYMRLNVVMSYQSWKRINHNTKSRTTGQTFLDDFI